MEYLVPSLLLVSQTIKCHGIYLVLHPVIGYFTMEGRAKHKLFALREETFNIR